MLKSEYPKFIADRFGIPPVQGKAGPWMSTEGTVGAPWVRAVSARMGLPYQGKVRTMAAMVEAVGEVWNPDTMASVNTTSRGGGNISTPAFQALLRGLEHQELGPWHLAENESVQRVALHDRYGGVRQGGISPAAKYVFLFTDDAVNRDHGYLRDHWDTEDPDVFHYCGEGQIGNQSLRRYNRSLLRAVESGKSIRLFQGVRGSVTYVTELVLDSFEPYYWAWGPGRDGLDRRVLMFRLRPKVRGGDASLPKLGAPADLGGVGVSEDTPYVPADEASGNIAAAPVVNLELLERATRAHATTQNLFAEWLTAHGFTALSPGPGQPLFDIAWRDGETFFVAEVKSLPLESELVQLRLGLGQVLDYAHALSGTPILVVERRPRSKRWEDLCQRNSVILTWPSNFESVLGG